MSFLSNEKEIEMTLEESFAYMWRFVKGQECNHTKATVALSNIENVVKEDGPDHFQPRRAGGGE